MSSVLTPTAGPGARSPGAGAVDPYAVESETLFEVVNGGRVEKITSLIETRLATRLASRLDVHVEEHGLGQIFCEAMFATAGSGNHRKPDVAFVSNATWPITVPIPRVNAWTAAPDPCVEVISPTDQDFAVRAKVREYFRDGVKEVWLVYSDDPEIRVYRSPTDVRTLRTGDDLTGDPLLPGFRLPLAKLFADVAAI